MSIPELLRDNCHSTTMPLLEVEQKFAWTLSKLKLLERNAGHPPFKYLTSINTEIFRDTYYDTNDVLFNSGLWVRKRCHLDAVKPSGKSGNPVWEAKKAVPGSSFARSTFEETQDTSRILRMVAELRPHALGHEECFGLDELCQFTTNRQTFLVDEKFTVALDTTDFGHSVGEVEVMTEDAEKGHADIDAVLKTYAWFFDNSKPKGKLSAYFEKFPPKAKL